MDPYRIGGVCCESFLEQSAGFCRAYSLFVILPNRRSITACIGGLLLVLTVVLGWREAFFEKIGWNVMGLFSRTVWLELISTAGFEPLVVPFEHSSYSDTGHEVFLGRRPVVDGGA